MIQTTRLLKNREEHHEEVDSKGSWAISYGDMITLLLSFFIIFFSVDPTSKEQASVKLKFSLIETLDEKTSAMSGNGVDDKISVGKKDEKGIDPTVMKQWNGLAHDQGHKVIIEFPGVSFFDTAETKLTRSGEDAIKKFVQVYMPYAGNYFVSIRAFADRRTIAANTRYRFKDNLELTALRSVATMRVLQKAGIPLSRIRVGGYGELVVTAAELESIPKEKRSPSSELDLARKIVLVIEPEVLHAKK